MLMNGKLMEGFINMLGLAEKQWRRMTKEL